MISLRTTVLLAVVVAASATCAQAHFLWIAPGSSAKDGRVHVYFSESPEPDDPQLLGRLTGLKVQQVSSGETSHTLELKRGEDSLIATPVGAAAQSFSLNHTYGLLDRNGEVFLLVYHGRMYPANSKNHWTPPTAAERLPLELVPSIVDGRLVLRVLWQGQPLAGAELHAVPAGVEPVDGKSDASGQFSVPASRPGQYAVRAKYIEQRSGERDGKKYATVRHYSTLVVTIAGESPSNSTAGNVVKQPMRKIAVTKMRRRPMHVPTNAKKPAAAASGLPDLPFGITSFGAALLGQNIYVCEGQLGPAHEYSLEEQSDRLLRLDLKAPRQWEVVGTVPHRAGLAMVAYDGKAYRIGGFEARNKKGEPADLHSTRDCARFDPASGRWEDLPPLPQARSSHDAVMAGSRLIVIGGWDLRGKEPTIWCDSALEIDLSSPHPEWKELPRPPFHRRALAVGESHGKVYVLGGMNEKGPTMATDVLDLASGKWSPGPKLPGEGLEGFGGTAATCAGRLYATTYSGKLWVLSEDGREWQNAGHLAGPRFFHRLLNRDDASLIVIGGGNMESGKDPSLEIIPVGGTRTAGR